MVVRTILLAPLVAALATGALAAGGIEVENVPAAAFGRVDPRVDDCTYDHDQSALLGMPGNEQCCVMAPVSLPHGAEVEALTLYFVKAEAEDLSVGLYRSNILTSGQVQQMAVVTSNAFSPSSLVRVGLDLSVDHAIVDNSTFTYYVGTVDCLDSEDHSLYSALVSYSPGGAR